MIILYENYTKKKLKKENRKKKETDYFDRYFSLLKSILFYNFINCRV